MNLITVQAHLYNQLRRCCQLIQLRLPQLAQLDVEAHLGGVGGRGRQPAVLQSQQQEWQLLQLWQGHVWRSGGNRRVLGGLGVDVVGEWEAGVGGGSVADDVAVDGQDGEDLTQGFPYRFSDGGETKA
jgi:hypothetical protein